MFQKVSRGINEQNTHTSISFSSSVDAMYSCLKSLVLRMTSWSPYSLILDMSSASGQYGVPFGWKKTTKKNTLRKGYSLN